MKIKLLREFLILAETLNFTKAAQKIHITQPVLSRHVKELEEYLGTELLCRDTHRVKLTSAGNLLREESRKIIQQYDNSLLVMNSFTGQNKQKLSIVYLGEAFNHILYEVINNYRLHYPNVSINYRDAELDEAIEYLKTGLYDLGFVLRPNLFDKFDEFDNFSSLTFLTDTLCVAVNKEHELATCQTVSLKDVVHYPIIRQDPKEFSLIESYTTDFLKKYGLKFKIYKEYPNLKTCFFNLELNKDAILLVPKHRLYLLGKNSVLLDLIEQDCLFNMELIWDCKNINPCISQFIKEFKQFLHNQNYHLQS